MLRAAVDIYSDPETPHGCLLYLGAFNCAPANKSVQDRMRTRVQAPELIRKRLERGVAEGDVPMGVDVEPLVSLYASFVHACLCGRAMEPRAGQCLPGVAAAMAAWDRLTG